MHSYTWGKLHEVALHELSYVPPAEQILVDYEAGEATEVTMHDGSKVILKKLAQDYDPTDRAAAMRILEESNKKQVLITGLIFISPEQPDLADIYQLPDTPLNRLTEDRLRPPRATLDQINDLMF